TAMLCARDSGKDSSGPRRASSQTVDRRVPEVLLALRSRQAPCRHLVGAGWSLARSGRWRGLAVRSRQFDRRKRAGLADTRISSCAWAAAAQRETRRDAGTHDDAQSGVVVSSVATICAPSGVVASVLLPAWEVGLTRYCRAPQKDAQTVCSPNDF